MKNTVPTTVPNKSKAEREQRVRSSGPAASQRSYYLCEAALMRHEDLLQDNRRRMTSLGCWPKWHEVWVGLVKSHRTVDDNSDGPDDGRFD